MSTFSEVKQKQNFGVGGGGTDMTQQGGGGVYEKSKV